MFCVKAAGMLCCSTKGGVLVAEFFTVRDSRFRGAVDRWKSSGWVKPWFTQNGHTRYRGTNGMARIMQEIAQPLNVRTATTVDHVQASETGWQIRTDAGEEFSAKALILTPPAPQSLALLTSGIDRLPAKVLSALKSIEFDPCFALLVTLSGPSGVPAPGCVRPETGPIGFIADNTQKGISDGAAALTIHATAAFTRSNFELPHEEVAQLLIAAAAPWLGSKVLAWQLHNWKYSQPITLCTRPFIYTAQPQPLALAGDAFGGPRIEGAFLSGMEAAGRIVAG
jgi:renalase